MLWGLLHPPLSRCHDISQPPPLQRNGADRAAFLRPPSAWATPVFGNQPGQPLPYTGLLQGDWVAAEFLLSWGARPVIAEAEDRGNELGLVLYMLYNLEETREAQEQPRGDEVELIKQLLSAAGAQAELDGSGAAGMASFVNEFPSLRMAAVLGLPRVVELLVEHGADPR